VTLTLTLTLDGVILHTVMHVYLYIPNFVEIEETFCGRTEGRTDGRADKHLRLIILGRLGEVDLKIPFSDELQPGFLLKRFS